MYIGNLPEDTSVSDDGYVLYTEDGIHVKKVKVDNFRSAGGVGLKYWKETENSIYRVQHNEGQWLFNDFFVVPGNAEMIVGYRYWDFEGEDDDKTDPILVGHTEVDPITGDTYTYTTEEPGPEVLWIGNETDCPQKYYIFKRLSNKPVMGGMLWYKFWGDPNTSRNQNVDLRYNLPGWILMSTDPDDLTYQLIERECFSYDDFPAEIQERIDNGYFRPDFAEDRVIATISPLEQTFTHSESGAIFYISGMPSLDVFELNVGINRRYTGFYSFTATKGNDQSSHPYFGTPELYYSQAAEPLGMPDDGLGPGYTPYPATGNYMSNRASWVNFDIRDPASTPQTGTAFAGYKLSNVKFDSYAWHKEWRGARTGALPRVGISSANCYHCPLAYLGAVWNHSGFAYGGDSGGHGRDAITYIFHDGEITYPQGFFTALATGYNETGLVFYAGSMATVHDEPEMSDVNISVDRNGNIVGKSIAVEDQILSDDRPVIGSISPLLSEGTEIANIYPIGSSTPTKLIAPASSGERKGITTTLLWENNNSGSATQVSSIILSYDPGNFDLIMVDFRESYYSSGESFKYYVYIKASTTAFMPNYGAGEAFGSTRNNYVSLQTAGIKSGVTEYYNIRYGGSAFIKRIVGIKLYDTIT